jgi:prepilin-type N-terminal cleavage/methylation domain-containing protein
MSATIQKRSRLSEGFTLIELSIVLVIIGLIIGGVLVGQDLIRSAGTRATITQIEKYNQAVNTFRSKYGQLPGDISDPDATNFGFNPRGQAPGSGDGNGVIEGTDCNCGTTNNHGNMEGAGETVMFWVDLSKAGLLEGSFNKASPYADASSDITGSNIDSYLPAAKLGGGNYIYVWSGGYYNGNPIHNGLNYYGIFAVTNIASSSNNGFMYSSPSVPVRQAYAIDSKIDDGAPLTGNITVYYLDSTGGSMNISAGIYPATAATCYDNNNNGPLAPYHYELNYNNGASTACGISIKFQ